MRNPLMTVSGRMNSALLSVAGISEEHKKYLNTGYCCPSCQAANTNLLGSITTSFYAADGHKVPLITGGALRGDTAECPKCGYRWKLYGTSAASPAPDESATEVLEAERSEEVFGEDRRVIDNIRSSSPITRTITFTKEWTRTYEIQSEKTQGAGGEVSFGLKDTAALKLSAEEKLRAAYSASNQSKETCSEQVTCEVQAHTRLTVVVRWKRLWQHGHVLVQRAGQELRIPFRVVVGVTFDQEQIEGSETATSG